ncbi:MAG: LuxR C-terminal-related transcriptional regulator [Bacteroidota bacterium]
MNWLVVMLLISSVGPAIRFRNHSLRYFFMISAITDLLVYLIGYFAGASSTWIQTYIVMNTILFFLLPELKLKYKVGAVLFLVLYYVLERSDVTFYVIGIMLMAFIGVYFLIEFVKAIKNEGSLLVYPFLILLVYTIGSWSIHKYYSDIMWMMATFPYKIYTYTAINLLLTVLGPDFKIKLFTIKPKAVYPPDDKEILDKLTFSERKIFSFLRQSKTNKEIAEILNIDVRTVSSHLYNIKDKLELKSVRDLKKIARDLNEGQNKQS